MIPIESNVDAALTYMFQVTRHIPKGNRNIVATALLIELGFRTNSDGFCYLRNGIIMKMNHPEMHFMPLYADIGKIYGQGATYMQVEQVCRRAIQTACKFGSKEKWDYFFPDRHLEKKGCPSDSLFISYMACMIDMWDECSKEVGLDGTE